MSQEKQPTRDMSRRSFLCGALALAPMASGAGRKGPKSPEEPSSKKRQKRDRRFPLWCDRGGLFNPSKPSDEEKVVAFVDKCVRHGVTELVPWNGTRVLVDAARDKGIRVHPYLAFNRHGGMKATYAWSVDFRTAGV
jgi:hypothetical protein